MIDLGEFTPATTLGPQRVKGEVIIGRLTTTDEQKTEAVAWMTEQLAGKRKTEGRAKIIWSRGEPTILELRVKVEHLGSEPVYVPHDFAEQTLGGAVIPHSEEARHRLLEQELRDLVDREMLK